ncbi:MAG: YqgE/AlgH family protein [Actinomycetota bacterium]|nr:YqgE/AlgH family protein [Actinomycetota bacterium]
MSGAEQLTGRLLVATPKLEDPNFARTVVLMLDHDDDGALGVIISRPTSVPVAEVLPGWSALVTGPDVLFSGGPVATDSALAIAVVDGDGDDEPLGWKELYPGAGLVDLDAPPELLADVLTGMRVFAGYAGWGSGQLEGEIAEGAWYVVPAEPDDLLDPDAGNLWRRVLRRQPGELAFVHTCPLDPTQN